MAVLSLPFVFLGLLPDFWSPFDEYAGADDGPPCHLLPRAVQEPSGQVAGRPRGATSRAVAYEMRDVAPRPAAERQTGSSWRSTGSMRGATPTQGRRELQELRRSRRQADGRCPDALALLRRESPRQLEAAGFAYDSTWGYNDAVGYRAGTSQVFRFAGSANLLELPLTVMDSALFYPDACH